LSSQLVIDDGVFVTELHAFEPHAGGNLRGDASCQIPENAGTVGSDVIV
jgi:hypothetical protein